MKQLSIRGNYIDFTALEVLNQENYQLLNWFLRMAGLKKRHSLENIEGILLSMLTEQLILWKLLKSKDN